MNGIWQKCCNCKSDMWVPDALNTAALARRGNDGIGFYCAYGHKQFYTVGESDETKLRRERDQLQQRIAQRDDEIKRQRELKEAAERREAAQKANVTKLKKRASAGVCPCCNRTFLALQKHMQHKHPQFTVGEGANVVRLRKPD